jgi:hypothetical protein
MSMPSLRPLSVLIIVSILTCGGIPALLLSGPASSAQASTAARRDGWPAAARDNVNYMNKTGNTPNIDGNWDAAAWAKGKVYDISNGAGKAYMYIMFTAVQGVSNRLYIGIDVPADQTNDPGKSDLLSLSMDGDNDGKITYTNSDPAGGDTGIE